MSGVKLQTCRTRKLFNQVNVTEYVFYWPFYDIYDHNGVCNSNCFDTNDNDYKYKWKLTYSCKNETRCLRTGYISLWLESCHPHSADNILFVKLGVNTSVLHKNSKVCLLSYDDASINAHPLGKKIEERVQDFFGITFQLYFVVKIKIIWKDLTNLELHNTNKLSTDFGKLYIDKHLTDVSFVFTNNQVIKAHKLILMARSPVFQAMFQSDMLESKQNRVEIKDMDQEIFEKLLHYIYTGRMEVTPADQAIDILIGADKYALIEYRDYCANELMKLMNIENAANNLIVSSLLNLDSLKTKAIEFILCKKQEVMKTEGYKNLLKNHLHLIAELFEKSQL